MADPGVYENPLQTGASRLLLTLHCEAGEERQALNPNRHRPERKKSGALLKLTSGPTLCMITLLRA